MYKMITDVFYCIETLRSNVRSRYNAVYNIALHEKFELEREREREREREVREEEGIGFTLVFSEIPHGNIKHKAIPSGQSQLDTKLLFIQRNMINIFVAL